MLVLFGHFISGMEFTSSGTCIRGTLLVIRDVVAMGLIPSTGGKVTHFLKSFAVFLDLEAFFLLSSTQRLSIGFKSLKRWV